jgi:hypothetical protein
MRVGLSPNGSPPIEFKAVAISFRYPTLSTTLWPTNAVNLGGPIPNNPQPISVQTTANKHRQD